MIIHIPDYCYVMRITIICRSEKESHLQTKPHRSLEKILETLPLELGTQFTERLRKRRAFADENLDSFASLNSQLNSLIYSTKINNSNFLIYNVLENDRIKETYKTIFNEHLKFWMEQVNKVFASWQKEVNR